MYTLLALDHWGEGVEGGWARLWESQMSSNMYNLPLCAAESVFYMLSN